MIATPRLGLVDVSLLLLVAGIMEFSRGIEEIPFTERDKQVQNADKNLLLA